MKEKLKFFIFSIILIFSFLLPLDVYAVAKDPWEVTVEMNVSEKNGDEYVFTNSIKTTGLQSTDKAKAWNTVFKEYKEVIIGVSGICTLTFVALFIFNFMKLGQAAGNPQLRSQALTALLWTGIAAAGCGGFTLFVGFTTNLFRT